MNQRDGHHAGSHRFAEFIDREGIEARVIETTGRVATVAEAARAVGCEQGEILKTLLFQNTAGQLVVAIAAGNDRIDRGKLAEIAGVDRLKMAPSPVVQERLDYPAGGVPPLDLPHDVPVVVDAAVTRLSRCFAGAGSERHLVELDPAVIVERNSAVVADIVDSPDFAEPALGAPPVGDTGHRGS
jgi:prolyl-tRNA editing enzyme YbaK/EbsC (Cys-tRNA(Pro) deacylase)